MSNAEKMAEMFNGDFPQVDGPVCILPAPEMSHEERVAAFALLDAKYGKFAGEEE